MGEIVWGWTGLRMRMSVSVGVWSAGYYNYA